MRRYSVGWVIGVWMLLAVPAAFGQTVDDKPVKPADNYDVLLQQYLAEARATAADGAPGSASAAGSLWMAGLASDLRARRQNDLLTIRVVESVTGLGSADSSLDKQSSASASLPNLFGLESALPGVIDPANLATLGTSTSFQGGGSTTRTGQLSAVLTARVAEVLPNGDLLVQGVREIEINGDRQMLVLTGVVRPADISTSNVVVSTAVGQMRIRYFGRGLIKDNLSPGWLVRILNKIF
jgi:flagellar L-ring protein precursor FlgH